MKMHGAWTAVVTPMNPDLSVNWDGLNKNIDFQLSQGITGVVAVGTTGESPTLDWEEHDEVIERVLAQCKGKCGVLAGTGSNSTEEAIKSTAHAVKSGAEAVLMVDCYYNGPSSQELRDDYYSAVASEFPNTTIVPYVIPGRTGTALSVEDLVILAARHKNINSVKEATGDLTRMAYTRSIAGPDFSIMSGDDDLTYTMLTDPNIKANGVISVMSNIVPGAIVKMVKLVSNGDVMCAEKIKDALAPLFAIVAVKVYNERELPSGQKVMVNDRYRNPLPVKALMEGLGMPSGPARKPLGKMTSRGIAVVRSAVKSVWDNNPEMLQPIADFYGIDIAARINDDGIWASLAL
ncbi:MAG: 4-hydroxy-tetrahydrodipicolinate synthase [Armatimonadetes bacterium]|nr:4-hydroxy-tetrahydrodipicolinate synthase [Armatimonadota bacterium]